MTQNFHHTGAAPDVPSTIEKVGNLWCAFMHDSPSWPIHGHYRCLVCGRRYPVSWEGAVETANQAASAEHLDSTPAVHNSLATGYTHIH